MCNPTKLNEIGLARDRIIKASCALLDECGERLTANVSTISFSPATFDEFKEAVYEYQQLRL